MADQKTIEERVAAREERRSSNAKARRAYRAKQKAKRAAAPKAEVADATHAREHGPGAPKVRQGVVVSAKPDKTITVRIDIARRHRRYEKIVRSTTKLHAHDESNDAHEGDVVRVSESRPLSRNKRWKLEEVVERAK